MTSIRMPYRRWGDMCGIDWGIARWVDCVNDWGLMGALTDGMGGWLIHWPADCLIDCWIGWLGERFDRPLISSSINRLIQRLIHSLHGLFTRWLTNDVADALIGRLIARLTLIDIAIDWATDWLRATFLDFWAVARPGTSIDWLIRAYVHSYIRAFIQLLDWLIRWVLDLLIDSFIRGLIIRLAHDWLIRR